MPGTADDFLKSVLKSGLLDRTQLQDSLRGVPGPQRTDPKALAEHLVRGGKLSSFQAQKLLQGATLGLTLGPFQILTPIGRGGMGTVYLALDTRNHQHVAVKVLPPRLASAKSHYLARFEREKELSIKVVHPNIAMTFEVGQHKGVHYIVMEYIPGASLHRLVKKVGPLTVPRTARLFMEVATALEHAHSINIIHRDLKPSNIMITPNDHAKVLDLGLAMLEGENSEPVEVIGGEGYVVGSLDYMAPEQTENSLAIDGRADLYALGCSLYFTLTGTPPFADGGQSKRDKVHAQRHLEAFPVHHRNPDVPEKFSYLIEKMMSKNPDRRLPTAKAVREELQAWCPVESEKPMDQSGDQSFQAAIAELEKAPLAGEQIPDEPILPIEEPAAAETPPEKPRRGLDLFVGFWAMLVRLLKRK